MKPDRLNACLQLVAQTVCGFDLTEYLAKAEKQLRGFVVSAGAEEASIFMGTPDARLAKQVAEVARFGLRGRLSRALQAVHRERQNRGREPA